MRIAICDDERSDLEGFAERIGMLTRKYNIAADLEYFDNGKQLLFHLDDNINPPNIIYLDIFLPGISGIQTAKELRKRNYLGEIIFISNSDRYAFEAFDVDALNYIVKPTMQEDKFEEVFLKATQRAAKKVREVITVSCAGENKVIPIADILYFEVSKYVVTVYFGEESFEFYSTLGKIENGMIGKGFVRVHRSFLVSQKHIREMNRQEIVLSNGAIVPVGRSYWQDLKTEMDKSKQLQN